MAKFSVNYEIRSQGAIGIFLQKAYEVEAESEQEAVDAARALAHSESYETRNFWLTRLDGPKGPIEEQTDMERAAMFAEAAPREMNNPPRR